MYMASDDQTLYLQDDTRRSFLHTLHRKSPGLLLPSIIPDSTNRRCMFLTRTREQRETITMDPSWNSVH